MPCEANCACDHEVKTDLKKLKKAYILERARISKEVKAGESRWIDRTMLLENSSIKKALMPHINAKGIVSEVKFYANEQALIEGKISTLPVGKFIGGKYEGPYPSDLQAYISYINCWKVVVTKNRGTIRHAYETGPQSCMKFPADIYVNNHVLPYTGNKFKKLIHPTQAWGGPDTSLAIVYDNNGNVIARCVVVDTTKSIVKMYSNPYEQSSRAFLYWGLSLKGYMRNNQLPQKVKIGTVKVPIVLEDGKKLDAYSIPYVDFPTDICIEDGTPTLLNISTGIVSCKPLVCISSNLYAENYVISCDLCGTPIRNEQHRGNRRICMNCAKKYSIKWICARCRRPGHNLKERFCLATTVQSQLICSTCTMSVLPGMKYCPTCNCMFSQNSFHCPSCGREYNNIGHYKLVGNKFVNVHKLRQRYTAS